MENNQSSIEKKPDGFLVVGLGASAGGIQALKEFFSNVPVDSGIAYVVILHLSPDHDSHLAEVLQVVVDIPVKQVTERVKIAPDHIFVVPPNQHLIIEDGFIAPSVNLHIEERRAPVDIFFRHLADTHGPRAVCVVLSGTGANGSMGLKRVKEMGGVAYVQNPREAEFNEMPRNSIATELVDEVLPVAEIPASIIAYRNRLGTVQITLEPENRSDKQQQALREIFTELRIRTGHDFTNYKRATLLRRIERRINIRNLTDLPSYAALIRQNPDETTALLKDLLISVTNFFRDSKPFQSVELDIAPAILQGKNANDQIRIWVAGCATGEEAYSLAMLFAERTLGVADAPSIQIFATDIDQAAIATARDGFYTINDAADVSPDRLRRFFNKEGDGYRVRRELREMILFANHNFLKDPPFSRLDMVSCRNVLIYLNHTAQERVMETFHFALKPEGILFLGSSESVDGAGDLYAIYNRENHVFQAKKVPNRHYPVPESVPKTLFQQNQPSPEHGEKEGRSAARSSFGELHQKLLEEYAPPSVVVNEGYEIVHMSEKVGRYFEFTAGEPTQNLLKLVRTEIRLELRAALYQAVQQQTAVEVRNIKLDTEDVQFINLQIRPVLNNGSTATGFILVIFEPDTGSKDAMPVMISSDDPVAKQLEEQLIRLNEQLRHSNEQHEFQAEELKAANEELQAMNEELRSAAEELETGKEELQSINEELHTVNQELKIKIEEISITGNNLQNLINSADVGTIFLDRSFRTRLFTPAVREIFNLIPSDYGRPISDITNKLEYPDLLQDAEAVLDKLTVVEREVTTSDNRYYMMRVLPYRTADDRINGVVITFFDISRRKRAEQALRKSEEHLRLLIESAKDYAILTLDTQRQVVSWSNGAEATFGYSEQEIIGQSGDIIFTPEDRAGNAPQTEAQKAGKEGRAQNERWHIRKNGSRFWGSGSVSPLRDGDGTLLGFVKIMRDLTESKEEEERYRVRMEKEVSERTAALKESRERYASLIENTPDVITRWDKDLRLIFANSAFEAKTGMPNESILGKKSNEMGLPDNIAVPYMNSLRRAFESMEAVEHFNSYATPGGIAYFYSRMVPERNPGGEVMTVLAIARDITELKEAEQNIILVKEELAQRATNKYLTLFNSIDEAVVWCEMIKDKDGNATDYRLLELNPAFEKMTGLSVDGSRGKTAREVVPTLEEWWIQTFARVAYEGKALRFENKVEELGRWFSVYASPVGGSGDGQFVAVYNDVTERKQSEETMRNTADRLQLALNAGKLGTYEYDFETAVYLCTAQHKANFGFAEHEPVSLKSLKERIVPADRIYMEAAFDKALDKDAVYATEYRTQLPGGDVRWIRSVGRYLYNDNDAPQKMVGITLDITEERMFTEELSKQVKERTIELQQSNNDLQQFAHVASHDLKEPVRKIKIFNSRIIDDFNKVLPEKAQMYLDKINRAADRMFSMIEGVLNYSKLGSSEHALQPVDLNKILRNIEIDLEVLIYKKNAAISTTDLPVIDANETLIYQLFYNLVLNSIKFSKADEPSRIYITCAFVIRHQKDYVEIIFSDNGIGFEQQYANTIFDTFTRLNPADMYEGTGLGLALCKKIVERHGGSISATSEPGKGAIFTILIPRS